jgi:CBS-domain-containing membrane protein
VEAFGVLAIFAARRKSTLSAGSTAEARVARENPNKRSAAMATTARDVMSDNAECVGENDSVLDAAKRLAELDVGAMPICGEDDRLKGMLTDRDIVVKVLAQGKDPADTKAGEHELVGIVSQADLAKAIDESKVGELVEAISAAP